MRYEMTKTKKADILSEAECLRQLSRTSTGMIYTYIQNFTDKMYADRTPFRTFMYRYRQKVNDAVAAPREKLRWNHVFERAGLSNTYGYKLISGKKATLKRDTILRLCFACSMSLSEAEEALSCSCMPSLRARNPRDAVIILAFLKGIDDPEEVSRLLMKNRQSPLEPCCMDRVEAPEQIYSEKAV